MQGVKLFKDFVDKKDTRKPEVNMTLRAG